MKHIKEPFLIVIVLLFCLSAKAQKKASVEKNVFGVQIGLPPLFLYNETKLSNSIALRSELSMSLAFESYGGNTNWGMAPALTLTPRYYYNLNKRLSKDKRIDSNSGNYLGLMCGYNTNWYKSSQIFKQSPELFVIPSWGIRRNIGNSFDYEFSCGVGYMWTYHDYTYYDFFGNKGQYQNTEGDVCVSLRLTIGYHF